MAAGKLLLSLFPTLLVDVSPYAHFREYLITIYAIKSYENTN